VFAIWGGGGGGNGVGRRKKLRLFKSAILLSGKKRRTKMIHFCNATMLEIAIIGGEKHNYDGKQVKLNGGERLCRTLEKTD